MRVCEGIRMELDAYDMSGSVILQRIIGSDLTPEICVEQSAIYAFRAGMVADQVLALIFPCSSS
jgi:hypothetical protein